MLSLAVLSIGAGGYLYFTQIKDKIIKTEEEGTTKLADGQLRIKINTFIEFEDGKSEGKANIENKSNNIYSLYVKIILDNGEEIYRSSILDPGEMIENITLKKNLAQGEYKAIAYFVAIDKYQNEIGQAGAEIKMIIEH